MSARECLQAITVDCFSLTPGRSATTYDVRSNTTCITPQRCSSRFLRRFAAISGNSSAERARNSRRMCTSKTQDLKPFRIRTYEKTPGGPPSVTSSAQRPYSLARGGQQVIQQAFAAGRDNGPGAQSLVHCLSHGGSHLEQIRHPQLSGRAHPEVPKVSVSLTNHKTKASKTCSRDSW